MDAELPSDAVGSRGGADPGSGGGTAAAAAADIVGTGGGPERLLEYHSRALAISSSRSARSADVLGEQLVQEAGDAGGRWPVMPAPGTSPALRSSSQLLRSDS